MAQRRYPTGEAHSDQGRAFRADRDYFFLSTARAPPPIMVTNMS